MTTTRLWHALKRVSPSDPVYRRAATPGEPYARSLSFGARLAVVGLLILLFCGGISLAPEATWLVVFGALVILPLGYILLNGTLSGVGWTVHIAEDISREQAQGSFDLLSALPHGAPGASWRLCAAALSRHGAFGSEDAERVWILRTIFFLVALVAYIIVANRPGDWIPESDRSFLGILNLIALLIAIRIDDIQSVVASGLVGMLVPTIVRDPVMTRLSAIGGFLLVQIGSYALVGLLGFALLPDALAALGVGALAASIALPIGRVMLFFAVREGVNRALWHWLARSFGEHPREMEALSGVR